MARKRLKADRLLNSCRTAWPSPTNRATKNAKFDRRKLTIHRAEPPTNALLRRIAFGADESARQARLRSSSELQHAYGDCTPTALAARAEVDETGGMKCHPTPITSTNFLPRASATRTGFTTFSGLGQRWRQGSGQFEAARAKPGEASNRGEPHQVWSNGGGRAAQSNRALLPMLPHLWQAIERTRRHHAEYGTVSPDVVALQFGFPTVAEDAIGGQGSYVDALETAAPASTGDVL